MNIANMFVRIRTVYWNRKVYFLVYCGGYTVITKYIV